MAFGRAPTRPGYPGRRPQAATAMTLQVAWVLFSLGLAAGDEVTFTRDVAPILFENCTECHRPGQAVPFSLITYADARERARMLALVTGTRLMPPWAP